MTAATSAVDGTLDALLTSPSFFDDPYPTYTRLRDEAPVHWCEPWGAWVVTRHDVVSSVVKDQKRFASGGYELRVAEGLERQFGVELPSLRAHYAMKIVTIADPPEHGRLRRPIVRGLGPRVLAVAQPTTERLVREHIEAFGDDEVVDLVPNFSLPVPARLIAGLLGVPEQDQAQFSRWSHDIVAFLGGGKPDVDRAVAAERALSEFRAYLRELIAEARTAQRDDMMGILMRGSDGDAPLNDEELMATAVTLVFAGHETTANIVSNAVLALLEFPDQMEALRADPSLTEAAIEEALRYNGSVQRVRRVARDDVELEGQHIAGGDILLNFLGSANRDPRAWDEADRFDLSRSTTRHLGFGYGPHFCVGSALARMEAPIMLGALLERYGTIALEAPPRWAPNIVFRGPEQLLLRVS
jgi:cytochrome P450